MGDTPNAGTNGSIAQLSNGNVVVVSESSGFLFYKIFNSATGADVVDTTGFGPGGNTNADAVALDGGGFAVAAQRNAGGNDNNIVLTIANNAGDVSPEIVIDNTSANDGNPSIAQLDGGNLVVAWTRTVGSQTEIWYSIRDAAGGQVKTATLFDTQSAVNRNVSVTALDGGGFAFAYEDNEHGTGNRDITLATFDADGDNSEKFNVGDSLPNSNPSLTRLTNGLLAMAYSQDFGGGEDDSFVSLIDPATGQVLADRDVITTDISNDSERAVAAEFGDGHLFVVDNDATDGDVSGQDFLVMRTSIGDQFSSNNFAGDIFIDVVTGGDFSDTLGGGGGNDRINGLSGNDTITGGKGDDLLEGEGGVDNINGGGGNDRIFGMTEADPSGSVIADFLSGGGGNDQITAANGFNTIRGDEGNDTITGGTSGDTIEGGLGNDAVNGNNGFDRLTGGGGRDRMTGGGGNDVFDFNRVIESRTGALRDVITDFTVGADDINVSDIDAQASAADEQDFTFIGATAFTAEGQIRVLQAGAHTIVSFNTKGAAGADMQIKLLDFTAADLSLADFTI